MIRAIESIRSLPEGNSVAFDIPKSIKTAQKKSPFPSFDWKELYILFDKKKESVERILSIHQTGHKPKWKGVPEAQVFDICNIKSSNFKRDSFYD